MGPACPHGRTCQCLEWPDRPLGPPVFRRVDAVHTLPIEEGHAVARSQNRISKHGTNPFIHDCHHDCRFRFGILHGRDW